MAVKKKATPQALQKTGQPFEVSQSVIKTWRDCKAKYDYRYIQLLEKKRPIVQLIRGTMVGKCIDAITLKRLNPKAPAWEKELIPYEKEYGKLFSTEKDYYGDIINDVKRVVKGYEQLYAKDGFKYLLGHDKNPFELVVNVDILPGIVFTGHIDKMPQDPQGRVWDLDHKTCKNIPDIDTRFSDLQQVFYTWAAPLSGFPKLTGVIWDYIRTKPPAVPELLKDGGLSQRKNIDTTYDTYLAEIKKHKLPVVDYKGILGSLKPRGQIDFYQRIRLPTPSPVLIKNVVDDAKTSAAEIKEKGGVDKTRNMTRMCKSCEFYNLCQAEFRGLDASFIRKNDYRIQKEPRHDHSKEEAE